MADMEEKKLTDEELAKALLQSIEYSKTITYFDEWGNCKAIMITDILDFIYRLKAEKEELEKPKFGNWKVKFFKVQKEIETLKNDYIELDLEARELRTELDKELAEHEEFTKKAKAEIERLTEERDVAGYKNNTLIFDKSNLQAKNAELQKQVDELAFERDCTQAENERLINLMEKAVKDKVEKFAERVKMAFYYEFDELIPSIMSDKIDEIAKEITGVENGQ